MKVHLSGLRSFENRGVQALAVSLAHLVTMNVKNSNEVDFICATNNKIRDKELIGNTIKNVKWLNESNPLGYRIWSKLIDKFPNLFSYKIYSKFLGGQNLGLEKFECDIALSTGGDLYSLDYGFPILQLMRDFTIADRKPLVLYGASIGPFSNRYHQLLLGECMNKFTNVIVREKISERCVLQHLEVNEKLVKVIPDPAFALPIVEVTHDFAGYIGVNFSPYVIMNNEHAKLWAKLIDKEIDNGKNVVYIGHVLHEKDNPRPDDYSIYLHIKNLMNNDLPFVGHGLNCCEIKSVISSLEFLIAARTHCCIAAYSTNTPVYALAYSTKAYGLSDAIFNHRSYMLGKGETPKCSISDIYNTFDLVAYRSATNKYKNLAVELNTKNVQSILSKLGLL
jgi:polysaccharide pyruvyl transferase WcaK-like protein